MRDFRFPMIGYCGAFEDVKNGVICDCWKIFSLKNKHKPNAITRIGSPINKPIEILLCIVKFGARQMRFSVSILMRKVKIIRRRNFTFDSNDLFCAALLFTRAVCQLVTNLDGVSNLTVKEDFIYQLIKSHWQSGYWHLLPITARLYRKVSVNTNF